MSLTNMSSSCCLWGLAIALPLLLSSLHSVCFWCISVHQSQRTFCLLPLPLNYLLSFLSLNAVTPPPLPSLPWLWCCHCCHHWCYFNPGMVTRPKGVLFVVGSKNWGKWYNQLIVCYVNYWLLPAARSQNQAMAPQFLPLSIISGSFPSTRQKHASAHFFFQ